MKLLVISDAHIVKRDGLKAAYAPYVKEMDLWMKHVDEVTIIAPGNEPKKLLAQPFKRQDFGHISLRRLEFHRLMSIILSILSLPYQAIVLYRKMRSADHIHMRAPGNLTLLAGLVQILLPRKDKSIKYAGNFDPDANQPFAYRWQRKLFSSTRWTKNTAIMAYGSWPGSSSNVKEFFTATYLNKDRAIVDRKLSVPIKLLFVGTLTKNKRPETLLQLQEQLSQDNIECEVHFYGDGPLRLELQEKADAKTTFLHGNQPSEKVKEAYKNADFLVLNSQSEGWPKVVAEAMWHGCIPIASPVSCVPWMLNRDQQHLGLPDPSTARGIICESLDQVVKGILFLIEHPQDYHQISINAQNWSQQYTMETFEAAIAALLKE
ncbi:glycosyltransferase family 4 protein [Nonlabens ponticola]|uniref:Glycosyltransferase family 1 protein n=1 Tax=Nonlabens ponticola TaxID=2496866 RepID=A0A3S9MXL3_9FLAO|nr:glycosyltransferase family 4 protein [Nonlabens ponticola]AZQ43878.1 glycosyltransferase family 1 protein [Nonlabens ponticola]